MNISAGAMNPNFAPQRAFNYKDILIGKLARAVGCSVLSQIVIIVLYISIANINVLDPSQWITSTFCMFTHVSTLLFILIFTSIVCFQSIICAKDYVFVSSFCSTRFQRLINVFSVHNFLLLFLHIITGGLLVWETYSLVDVNHSIVMTSVDTGKYHLNSNCLCLLLGGFWIGFYFFIKVHVSSRYLDFPVIQQRKFFQFKTRITTLFRESASIAIWPTFYYGVLYYLWGTHVESYVMYIFGVNESLAVNSFLVYIYAWWFSTLYIFSMNLMRFFFYLYLTESCEFPLVKDHPQGLTLQEAIVMKDLPIVQNLACLDLYNLSHWSPYRRQVFFTLSQPGGHPHNWNTLADSVLKLFNEYIDLLKKSTDVPVSAPEKAIKTAPQSAFCHNPLEFPLCSPMSAQSKYRNFRNMSYSIDSPDVVTVSNSNINTIDNTVSFAAFNEVVLEKFQKIINFLKIFLGINFLFGELPQANIQKCLSNGRVIVWASQGISELAVASLVEDKYGIVQKDLPVIITTLVQLKQNLDKLNKIPALSRKITGLDDFHYKTKNYVHSAVKRSLLNLCLNFGDYFEDFHLNKETLQYLQGSVMLKC